MRVSISRLCGLCCLLCATGLGLEQDKAFGFELPGLQLSIQAERNVDRADEAAQLQQARIDAYQQAILHCWTFLRWGLFAILLVLIAVLFRMAYVPKEVPKAKPFNPEVERKKKREGPQL